MVPAILIGVAVVVAILVYLYRIGSRQMAEMKQRVLEDAIPTSATIVDVRNGSGMEQIGGVRRIGVELTLKIEIPYRSPYEATTNWLVDELAIPRVQPGGVVKVRVNKDHPDRIYPDVEWAKFTDWQVTKNE